MAKKLYFRKTGVNSPPTYSRGNNDANAAGVAKGWEGNSLSEFKGAGVATMSATPTAAGPTSGIEIQPNTSVMSEWISEPLSADITISGTITFNLWMGENNMSANVGSQCIVEKIDGATGAMTTVVNSERGVEVVVATPYAVNNWTASPTSTAFKRGDRIRVRVLGNDVGTMATGFTFNFSTGGITDGADGDSWIQFTENIEFERTDLFGTDWQGIQLTTQGFDNISVDEVAQQFVARGTTLTEIHAMMSKVGAPSDNVAVRLHADGGGIPGAFITSLGTWACAGMLVSPAFSLFTITGLSEVLVPGTTYWILFARTGSSNATNYPAIMRASGSVGNWPASAIFSSGSWSAGTSAHSIGIRQAGMTELYFTNTASPVTPVAPATAAQQVSFSRGGGAVTLACPSSAGWAAPIQWKPFGGSTYEWYSEPIAACTLGGLLEANLRIWSSATDAGNMVPRLEVAICNADGSSPAIWGVGQLGDGDTLTVGSEATEKVYVSGDDTAIAAGKRLRFRLYLNDSARFAMTAAREAEFTYGGAAGATGDSYIVLPITVAADGPPPTPIVIGRRAAATTVRGITLSATGAAPVTIGRKASATVVRGITPSGSGTATPVTIGRRAAATTVRGITLVPAPQFVPIGARASATVVRGITLSGTGTAAVTIGRKASATVVRGITLSGSGTATPVVIGTRAAATTVRGITLTGSGTVAVTIGRRAAATTVRGITLSATGAAPVTVGTRGSATTVRGITLSGTGTTAFTVGRRAAATTVYGITLVPGTVSVTIGRRAAATTVYGITFPTTGNINVGRRASATAVYGVTLSPSGAAPIVVGRRASATAVRGITLTGSGTTSFTIGTKASATVVRGITVVGSGTITLAIGRRASVTAVRGITLSASGSAPITIGRRAANTTVYGVTLTASGAAPLVIGRRASATVVRGITLSATGTANVTIGRRTSVTAVYGITLAGSGTVSLTIGRRASATAVYGMTLTSQGSLVPIGTRSSATVVRGVTLSVSGSAPIAVGTKASSTAVRGITLTGAGSAFVIVGRKASTTTVRGVTLSAAGTVNVGVGRRPSITVVRGVTLSAAGSVLVTIGRRSSVTVVRGVTLTASGAAAVLIGKRSTATVVRGVVFVGTGTAAILIGRRPANTTVYGLQIALPEPLSSYRTGYVRYTTPGRVARSEAGRAERGRQGR